jgi:tripartite-type tricarboxylate transporter receptor subunit TctC
VKPRDLRALRQSSTLPFCGISTPSLTAQGEQRRSSFFNIERDYSFGPNGVKSWDDMMHRKQFFLGATGNSSGGYVNGATLRRVLNAPVKQILGFPGSAELRIAIEQGELDGDCGAFSSIPVDWVRDHKAHPFVRFTKERLPEIPESAVFIDDLAETKDEKDLLDVLDAEDEVGRVLVMSSQVPADRVEVIREAFNATTKDPAFLADMKKQQLPVNPLSGQAAEQIVSKMLNASPAVVARAKQFYE